MGEIFKHYKLQRRDTFFIRITENRVADLRIFKRNGMEVEYDCQSLEPKLVPGFWFMKELWKEEYSGKS